MIPLKMQYGPVGGAGVLLSSILGEKFKREAFLPFKGCPLVTGIDHSRKVRIRLGFLLPGRGIWNEEGIVSLLYLHL